MLQGAEPISAGSRKAVAASVFCYARDTLSLWAPNMALQGVRICVAPVAVGPAQGHRLILPQTLISKLRMEAATT